MRKAIRIFDVVFLFLCVALFGFIIWGNANLPNSVVCYDDNNVPFAKVITYATKPRGNSVLVDSQSASPRREDLKLFGVVPIKEVSVTTKNSESVFVSGEAFGIKLYTDGVIVVGTQSVDTDSGKKNPATDCGIRVGDVIIAINKTKVYSSTDVQRLLNDNNGMSYEIEIKREDRYRTFILNPVYSQREGCYKAGMWVRDSTAGIGTLTYYDKNTGVFGALGHPVNDVDTNEIMPLLEGEAVCANVTSVQRATKGNTGCLECDFMEQAIGRLYSNTQCGIFGIYNSIPSVAREYPVASPQQVKKGDATIISTIDSNTPREYSVEITHISYNEANGERNMVVKITDSDLIKATGGIVQGMSGSPIIQDGRLIGALTHVIVSNPEKGYAVFAQSMLEESIN